MSASLTKSELQQICRSIDDEQIQRIERLVMFVGHAHSGHSLVGALIDAHPDAAISNHLNIPRLLLEHDLSETDLLKVILHHTQANQSDDAWHNTGYSYRIPGAFQGQTRQPLVIGDKQGGASTRFLRKHPELLQKIRSVIRLPIHLIFVHRNMYDNIAAFAHYWGDEGIEDKHVTRYFENLETSLSLQEVFAPSDFFSLSHEKFVAAPVQCLEQLYRFLGLSVDQAEISRFCSIVKSSAHARRHKYEWPEPIKNRIEQLAQKFHP